MHLERNTIRALFAVLVPWWLAWLGTSSHLGVKVWGQEPTEVVERLQTARKLLAEELVSALAIGRLRQQTLRDSKPVVVEHDVQIFFDAPKFRVHVIDISPETAAAADVGPGRPQAARPAAEDLNRFEQQPGNDDDEDEVEAEHDLRNHENGEVRAAAGFVQAAGELRNTRRSSNSQIFTERLVIFDGDVVYSVVSSNGRHRGKIFFDFQQQHVLRSTGYPYVPPLQLWQAGISAQLDPQKVQIQKLNQRGQILSEVNAAYTTKYYFFDEFDYDLRRVIFTVPKAKLPFREISLRWGESHGVRYVSRYASKDRYLSDNPNAPPVDSRNIEIEFSRFEADANIADEVFTLRSLNLPVNTPFDDHRSNVGGQPKQLKWNGQTLVDVAE